MARPGVISVCDTRSRRIVREWYTFVHTPANGSSVPFDPKPILTFRPGNEHKSNILVHIRPDTIEIWDVAADDLINVLPSQQGLTAWTWRHDGMALACSYDSTLVRIYDLSTLDRNLKHLLDTFDLRPLIRGISGIHYSWNSEHLIVTSDCTGEAAVCGLADKMWRYWQLPHASGESWRLEFSYETHEVIAIEEYSQDVRRWDLDTGNRTLIQSKGR